MAEAAAPGAPRPVYLNPGELLLTQTPCLISTILGSCVAVTLFCARVSRAAICHGTLPVPGPDAGNMEKHPDRFKYLSEAIPFMSAWFRTQGIALDKIEAKVFGGATQIGRDTQPQASIGTMNIQWALQLLENEGIAVKTGNVSGSSGRKIVFNTGTGEVWHRFL